MGITSYYFKSRPARTGESRLVTYSHGFHSNKDMSHACLFSPHLRLIQVLSYQSTPSPQSLTEAQEMMRFQWASRVCLNKNKWVLMRWGGHSYALINLVQIYKLHIVKTSVLLFALYFFFCWRRLIRQWSLIWVSTNWKWIAEKAN